MMYPYANFLIDFEKKHANFSHQNVPENSRAAVIVETRPLFFLPKVIRNVMTFLGPRWNLHVICGELSHAYIANFLQTSAVRVIKMQNTFSLPTAGYNKMLMSPGFWNSFVEEKLLIFQLDTLLAGSNIAEFEDFDYIGAPCGTFDENYVANGGLSLRSRSVMLKCLADFRPRDGVAEDVFFSQAVRRIGARVPDVNVAARFSVESIYTAHPFGVHGTDKCFHSIEIAEKIVRGIVY
ncbi:MAG: DUF5672 family protein [Steroidobacteraceae bacterium]